MFGSDKETKYESDSIIIPTLQPGIYRNAELTKVEFLQLQKKDKSLGKKALIFTFTAENGETHQHTEYESTDKDKAKNMVKRVGHILLRYVPEEKLVQNNQTFDSYAKWVIATLGDAYKGVKVDLKICGSVYTNQDDKKIAKSGFPNYIGFITRAGGELAFSQKEVTSNKEYSEFRNEKPDSDQTSFTGESEPVEGF